MSQILEDDFQPDPEPLPIDGDADSLNRIADASPFDGQLDLPASGVYGWCETHGQYYTPPRCCLMCELQAEAASVVGRAQDADRRLVDDVKALLKHERAKVGM